LLKLLAPAFVYCADSRRGMRRRKEGKKNEGKEGEKRKGRIEPAITVIGPQAKSLERNKPETRHFHTFLRAILQT
jgi:hypothetical protein